MTTWAISAAVCTSITVLLVLFFAYEMREGVRFGKNIRLHFDFYVLKASHFIRHFIRLISADLLRQIMHYTFHTLLGAILFALKYGERRIHDIQRANRQRARTSRVERTTRNKLDEIAEHKIAVALSEEEKRHRKEKHLLGG